MAVVIEGLSPSTVIWVMYQMDTRKKKISRKHFLQVKIEKNVLKSIVVSKISPVVLLGLTTNP